MRHRHRRTQRRRRRAEIAQPQIGGFVEFGGLFDVADGKDNVLDRRAAGFKAGADVLADLLDLRLQSAFADDITCRIARDLPADGLCWTYYFVGRYNDAVGSGDRALARSPGRNGQTLIHPFLAAAYAQMGRRQDAEGERAVVMRLSPFFDARIFAAQFGTQEARDHMLDGLKKAGFH